MTIRVVEDSRSIRIVDGDMTIRISSESQTLRVASATPIGVIDEQQLDPANMSSGSATVDQIIVADGAGGIDWADQTTGDVEGPGSSNDNRVVVFSGTTGKQVKEPSSAVTFGGQGIIDVGAVAGHVPDTRQIIDGVGITGGGDLSADRTLTVDQAALDPANMDSGSVVSGQVPLADGGGGIAWGDSAIGWIRISDITPDGPGVVDNKVFDSSGTILQSCRVSTLDLNFEIKSAFPRVSIESTETDLSLSPDGGHYQGTVAHTITGAGDIAVSQITPDGGPGATDTVTIAVNLPAELLTLSFAGGYPGSQTQLKAGDTYQVTGTSDKSIDALQVLDSGAGTSELVPVTPGTSFTASITIADRGTTTQALAATIQPRDTDSGALGPARATDELGGTTDGVDLVNLNDTYPALSIGTITYPGGQSALKNVESATVVNTASDYDTIAYDSPNGDLTIASPSTFQNPKTATRQAGSYNVSVDNFRVTANRAANDATTVVADVVQIANVAALATVSYPGARIRSGVAPGNDTTVTLSFDQQMQATPAMDPQAGRGTFTGAFSGGPTSWTNDLRVPDSENPATGASYSWTNVSATNLAGIVTNTITTNPTYVIGGFTQRTLNYAPFTANSTETFPLTTEGNLGAGSFSNGNPAVVQPFGTADTTDVGKEGWCAPTAASGTAVKMRMLHSPTVAANSGGLTLTLVEETA